MKPRRTPLPELDSCRTNQPAAPEIRERNLGVVAVLGDELLVSGFETVSTVDHRRLRTRPRTELRTARPRTVVGRLRHGRSVRRSRPQLPDDGSRTRGRPRTHSGSRRVHDPFEIPDSCRRRSRGNRRPSAARCANLAPRRHSPSRPPWHWARAAPLLPPRQTSRETPRAGCSEDPRAPGSPGRN